MSATAFVLPVLPGRVERLRIFARQLQGDRRADFETSQRRLGIRREDWFVRETASGSLALVYVEADDPAKALEALVRSRDPMDLWLKSEVAEITGVDFNHPPSGPGFQQILEYVAR